MRLPPKPESRPQVAIVIDDLGLDWARFRSTNRLPMPVTLAFLPYGPDAQAMVNASDPRHEVMLHLPMEPHRRKHDAGPDRVPAYGQHAIEGALATNLSKLSGYRGVNNHTGSLVTETRAAMETVLTELDEAGLYFLDSRTSIHSVAVPAGRTTGATVLEADLFLDGNFGRGGVAHVTRQLEILAATARAQGSAIAIGHPYPETLEALNAWAASEEGQGFRFVTTGELAGPPAPPQRPRLRNRPDLRG